MLRYRLVALTFATAALVLLTGVPGLPRVPGLAGSSSAPATATPAGATASVRPTAAVRRARPATPAPPAQPAPGSCPSGRVALTFDDGPSPTVTPRLVRMLRRLDVPATFFMVGSRVDAAPELARLVARNGFAIGNHTYSHANLAHLSAAGVRRELLFNRRALRRAGVHGLSPFVRPPYGAVDDVARRVIAGLHMRTVLWTVDSRDWTGLTSHRILTEVLSQVRARGRSTSVVLQHDGVSNSPATLAALPREIALLRREGFCLVPLGADGTPG